MALAGQRKKCIESIVFYDENESDDADGTSSESDFLELNIRYIRALSPDTDFDVGYTYNEGDDDDPGGDYEANTIDMGIVHRF